MVWATRTVTRDLLPTRLSSQPQPKRKSNLPKNTPNAKDELHTYHPTLFELPFEFFTSNSQNGENVLSFSLPFSVKNV
jgi:hypothetical protein